MAVEGLGGPRGGYTPSSSVTREPSCAGAAVAAGVESVGDVKLSRRTASGCRSGVRQINYHDTRARTRPRTSAA